VAQSAAKPRQPNFGNDLSTQAVRTKGSPEAPSPCCKAGNRELSMIPARGLGQGHRWLRLVSQPAGTTQLFSDRALALKSMAPPKAGFKWLFGAIIDYALPSRRNARPNEMIGPLAVCVGRSRARCFARVNPCHRSGRGLASGKHHEGRAGNPRGDEGLRTARQGCAAPAAAPRGQGPPRPRDQGVRRGACPCGAVRLRRSGRRAGDGGAAPRGPQARRAPRADCPAAAPPRWSLRRSASACLSLRCR